MNVRSRPEAAPKTVSASKLSAVPVELAERRQWVGFRLVQRPDSPKPAKVPWRCDGCGRASVADPASWGTLAEAATTAALELERGLDGIGYVFTADDPFTGVDFDDVWDNGRAAGWPEAWSWIRRLDSYAEWSPSGRGVHVFVRAELGGGRRSSELGLELYDRARFFTVTGRRVPEAPSSIRAAQADVDELARLVAPSGPASSMPAAAGGRPPLLAEEELIARAHAAANGAKFSRLWAGDWSGFGSQSEADLSLCAQLVFWLAGDVEAIDRNFRRSGLMREKWDERRGESTYGAETIAKAAATVNRYYDPQGFLRGRSAR